MKPHFISTTLDLCDGTPRDYGFKGRFRIGCDHEENALYIAVEVEDDAIVLDPIGNEAWSSTDGCEVFLSLKHKELESAPVQFVYRESPQAVFEGELNDELVKAVKVARASDDTHLTYEWRIDLGSLQDDLDLAKGAVIGFDMAYLDRDSADIYSFYSSSKGHWKHMYAKELGDLVIPPKGTQLVQLAGQTAWSDAGVHPPTSIQIQSVGSESTFFQLPVTNNGQFMLSLPAGDYALTAMGHEPSIAAAESKTLYVSKDTILKESMVFDVASETAEQATITEDAVVHLDLAHGQQPLSQLEELGNELGYSLRTSKEPLSSEILEGSKLLYLLGPTTRFADAEKEAVIEFVKNGGSLLLVVDESRRSSLSETQANDLIAPFGMKLTGDTEYVHNCGAIAKSGPIQEPCELAFSGGRAVEGGTPFGFQLDRDGNPSHPFAAYKKVTGGGRVIVLGEAMAAIFLGTPDGERLSGTPRNYAETSYWGKDSKRFNSDILTWLLAVPATPNIAVVH